MAGVVDGQGRLPPLREEVHCLPGPVQFDGSPSWSLYDPANNRFFRIGWIEQLILCRWSLQDPQRIIDSIHRDTTATVDLDDVEQFLRFLQAHHLLYPHSEAAVNQLRQQAQATRQSVGLWLLHHYLFFRIPLLRPDGLLRWLYARLHWIYQRWFAVLVVLVGLTGGYLVLRQWETFTATFLHFFNWQGLVQYFLALMLAKVLHEFGHALTAHHFGCRVPTMGVAFMVMYPMLYTDASETWRLTQRHQRLAVASAGIVAELGLAAFATLAWSFLDDGPWRSAAFLLASSTWILTLAINLSPFMRFDGYYLLADWVKVENLQPRAFAYALWRLRATLFRLDVPAPEQLPARTGLFFVLYAWGTWIYRFLLFLGIAWMVYHFFFKLLGIFLMAVEIGWFIIRPIWREVKNWPKFISNWRSGSRLGFIVVVLSAIVLIPWQQHLELPAQLKPALYAELYLPYPAQLQSWKASPGQTIAEGELLVTFNSNDLAYKATMAKMESGSLAWQVSYQGIDKDHLKQRQIQLMQLESSLVKEHGYTRQLEQLEIRSPLAGKVMEINKELQPGQWVKTAEPLLIIADTTSYAVEAFVSEQDVMKLLPEAEGIFYPDNAELPALPCRLVTTENGPTINLPPMLTSTFGGPIAVRASKEGKTLPEQAQYRLLLTVSEDAKLAVSKPLVLRGALKLEIRQSSIIENLWRQLLENVLKESGF